MVKLHSRILFKEIRQTIADFLSNRLQSSSNPELMVKSCSVLIQIDPTIDIAVVNYKPIACLNVLWKLLTDITTDKLCKHLENQDISPEESKDCRRRLSGT